MQEIGGHLFNRMSEHKEIWMLESVQSTPNKAEACVALPCRGVSVCLLYVFALLLNPVVQSVPGQRT